MKNKYFSNQYIGINIALINRVKFYVCTFNCFGGIQANAFTHVRIEKTLLDRINLSQSRGAVVQV